MLTSLFDPVAVHFRDLYTFSIWIKMHGRYHSCRITNHTFLYKGRWLPHARFLSYTFPNHNVVTTGNAPEVYYLSTTTAVMKRSWNLKVPQNEASRSLCCVQLKCEFLSSGYWISWRFFWTNNTRRLRFYWYSEKTRLYLGTLYPGKKGTRTTPMSWNWAVECSEPHFSIIDIMQWTSLYQEIMVIKFSIYNLMRNIVPLSRAHLITTPLNN